MTLLFNIDVLPSVIQRRVCYHVDGKTAWRFGKKIEELASTERTTKSQIIKNALREYIGIRKAGRTPYELGKA